MSFGLQVGFGSRPHCHPHHHHRPHHHHHRPHHHHHGFWNGFWRRPTIHVSPTVTPTYVTPHFSPAVTPTHVTPLSETGRKFANIGAALIGIGIITSIVGVCLAPASFGATGVLCGVGGALILGGLAASIYGHVRG